MLKSIAVVAVLASIYLVASLPLDFEGASDHNLQVNHRVKRKSNGLVDIINRWPNRTVPYRVNAKGFTKQDLKSIAKAIKTIHKKTCVRFVDYKDQKSFVTFVDSGPICFAPVGRGDGENLIQLPKASANPNCLALGTILHEIMHSLGFEHIHTAPDRDEFIKINWDLIDKKNHESFHKLEPHIKVTDFGLGYDFDSVMHYHSQAFTTDDEKHAMEALTGQADTDKMGNVGTLSDGDIARIRAMYNCDGDHPEQDFTGIEQNDEEITTVEPESEAEEAPSDAESSTSAE